MAIIARMIAVEVWVFMLGLSSAIGIIWILIYLWKTAPEND